LLDRILSTLSVLGGHSLLATMSTLLGESV
jgi:hypothetical protein